MIYTTNWNLVVKPFYYGNDRKTVLDGSQKPTSFIFFQYLCQWPCRLVSTCKKVSGYQKRSEILCSENQTKVIGSRIQLASMSLLLTILVTKFGVLDIIMYVKGLIGWFFHFCLWFWPCSFHLIIFLGVIRRNWKHSASSWLGLSFCEEGKSDLTTGSDSYK